MAEPSHPFQAHQGNESGQPPPGYGNAPPPSGAPPGGGYPGYGTPNGAPPPNVGYSNGAPQPTTGYSYGPPSANMGYPMSAPGNQYGIPAYAYGAPNPAVYAVGAPGYQGGGALGYPGSGAPVYPNGMAPGYPSGGAPGYPNGMAPGYAGGGPPGYLNDLVSVYPNSSAPGYGGAPGYAVGGAPGIAVYPDKPQGYPVGAPPPGYAYGAPSVVYPVGAYYPPGGGANGQPQAPPSQSPLVDPRNQIQTGRWTSGLCSCCDNCVPNLLMAWCCPCISLAQVYARLGLYRYLPALVSLFVLYAVGVIGNFIPSDSTETATYTYDPQTGSVVVTGAPSTSTMLLPITMAVGQSLFRLVVWQARSKVRERFQIPGSCIGDGCASCICSCCAIAQLATHVKSYTPGSCSFGGPDVLPAFTN
ncbi:hypothetical protein Gpo141_00007744 [Globisporangium polare]